MPEFITHVLGRCAFAGLQIQLQIRRCAPGSAEAFASEISPAYFINLHLPRQAPSWLPTLDTLLDAWSQSSDSEDGFVHRIALYDRPSLPSKIPISWSTSA